MFIYWKNLKQNSFNTFNLIYGLFFSFFILRVYEFYQYTNLSQEETIKIGYFIGASLIDFLISNIIVSFFVILISVFPISWFKRFYIIHFFNILILLINFILIQVFLVLKEPLDDTIFSFTWYEIKTIAGTNSIGFLIYIEALFLLLSYFIFCYLLKKIKLNWFYKNVYLCFMAISILCAFQINYDSEKHIAKKLVNNKASYFFIKSVNYFSNKKAVNYDLNEIDSDFLVDKPIQKEFPLVHRFELDTSFANYFYKKNTKPPNIVLIIVESLATSLVGKYSNETGEIMPFLDSLVEKSIYYPNTFATSERTYNVLPAILSSTPNAPENSVFMQLDLPRHYSLIGLLKKHYYSSFYCGVYLNFHGMQNFLKFNGIDYLVHSWEKQFDKKFSNENSWGYPDGDLFSKAILESSWNKEKNRSKLDVFLTISTHHPYIVPNQKPIMEEIKNKILSKNSISKYENYILNNLEAFSSFRYTDNSIRKFFHQLKNKKEFENTIFIITGDHGTELNNKNDLNKFVVPLIIYSKLIKKPIEINETNSHLGILPSILSLLKMNYKIKIPENVPFMSSGLAKNKSWKSNLKQVISSFNYKNNFMIYDNYFLSNDELFVMKNGLDLKEIKNNSFKKVLKNKMKNYTSFSTYCVKNNKLISEQDFYEFSNTKKFKIVDYKFLDKIKSNKEFLFISNEYITNNKFKSFRIEIEMMSFFKSKEQIADFPKFTYVFENNDSILLWKQKEFEFSEEFKKNNWNKVKMVVEINKNEIKNLKKYVLKHYLLNVKKENITAKKLVFKLLKK